MHAFRGLKELRQTGGLHLSANCVITRLNVRHLQEMLDWSSLEEVPVNFVLGEIRDRFHNTGMDADVSLEEEEKEELVVFFRKLSRDRKRFRQHSLRYARLADMLEHGSERRLACYYALGGAVLGSDGTLSYCPHSRAIGNCRGHSASDIFFSRDNLDYRREGLLGNRCRTCPPYNFNRMEVEKDILHWVKYSLFGKP
jgi:MoaA/NifB/PqqE/SkfB family radical SAM enzyme